MASYTSEIPPVHQAAINSQMLYLAALSARAQNIVAATQAEHRVAPVEWQEFFTIVAATRPDQLEEEIRSWARRRTRLGPPSTWTSPLARAITRTRLVSALRAQPTKSGTRLTLTAANNLIDGLVDNRDWPASVQLADDLGLRMGLFTIWATFSETGGQPYAGLPHNATALARELGWDDADSKGVYYKGDRPILLLEYESEDDDLRFPTMIEAWATEPLNYYFLPAPIGASHGRTKPWANAPDGTPGWPEAVHAPYGARSLTRRVLVVR